MPLRNQGDFREQMLAASLKLSAVLRGPDSHFHFREQNVRGLIEARYSPRCRKRSPHFREADARASLKLEEVKRIPHRQVHFREQTLAASLKHFKVGVR